jgi:hypothetical protein
LPHGNRQPQAAGRSGRRRQVTTLPRTLSRHGRLLIALAGVWLAESRALAQAEPEPPKELLQQPTVGRDLSAALACPPAPPDDPAAQGRTARFRLFRMMPGFLSDPPGLDSGDDPVVVGDPAANLFAGKDADGPNWIQVTLGADNPFFDFRWRGDPGGVGYYRVHSQVQIFDCGSTSLCLNCQAYAPAGLESGGVSDGPTVISPSLGWFQELAGGTALQGFVASNIRPAWRIADRLDSGFHYGVAWQCPVPLLTNSCDNTGVYLFMQALGRYRYEGETQQGRPAAWEFVPGVHWRVADSFWMSVGASRSSMLTCSWRF